MEILPAAKLPVTPAGNPLNVALVAPVDEKVMFVRGVFIQVVGELEGDVSVIVLSGVTVIVPLAVTVPQPPVRVTV